jgi:hypothetical protein
MNKMLKTNNSVTSLGPSHVKLSRENKGRILKLKDNNPENNLQLRNAKTKSYDSGDNDVKQLKDLNRQQNRADNARCNIYFDGTRASATTTASTTDRSDLLSMSKNCIAIDGRQQNNHRHGRQAQDDEKRYEPTERGRVSDNETLLKHHEVGLIQPKKRLVSFLDPSVPVKDTHHMSILKPSSYQRKELRNDRLNDLNANDRPNNHERSQIEAKKLNHTGNSNSGKSVPSSQPLSRRKEAAFQLGMLIDDLTLGFFTSLPCIGPCIGIKDEAPQ